MSPAATQTDSEAETNILEAADQLFYRRGVHAVTVADIRDASAVSLRRLYSLFPAKTDIVSGWLRHRHGTWMKQFSETVNTLLLNGVRPVDAIFDALGDWLISTDFRGCGFINTLAESAELTSEHRATIRGHKKALIAFIDDLPGLNGKGEALGVLVDGAIVQAAIFETTAPVAAARRSAATLTQHVEDPR